MQLLLRSYWTPYAITGIGETCQRAGRYLGARYGFLRSSKDPFDLIHHTDTGGISPVWELNADSANVQFGERYQAVNADWLQRALAFLNEDWPTFTFVDLGCGKGRALIVASKMDLLELSAWSS